MTPSFSVLSALGILTLLSGLAMAFCDWRAARSKNYEAVELWDNRCEICGLSFLGTAMALPLLSLLLLPAAALLGSGRMPHIGWACSMLSVATLSLYALAARAEAEETERLFKGAVGCALLLALAASLIPFLS
ncbi:MAG: hypothetical protein HY520_00180 [Candidatus Aenigmarchaeota archaeon]|nr:hypothetical protein [Candidatus Aenigmarchaeota archaeon]